MDSKATNRQRAVAALAVGRDGEDANELAKFMSPRDAEIFSHLTAHYSELGNGNESKIILGNLLASEKFSSISEIHPAWILEKLKDESPRVIGIILRFLPSKHVRFILKNLNPMICEQIPEMVESFSVAPEVLEVIRKRFEASFVPMRVSRALEGLYFEHLYYLKGAEFDELFRELGLAELAMALSIMPKDMIKIIYNRLDVKDAKKLKAYFGELASAPADIKAEARSSLLRVEGESMGPKQLIKMIGIIAFASALSSGDEELVARIMQKLSPKDGYLLKRFSDEWSVFRKNPALSTRRKDMIVDTVRRLAGEGRIDSAWSGENKGDDSPSQEPPSHFEEETATLSLAQSTQLA